MKSSNELYLSGDYLLHNPSWDEDDSPWKAAKIMNLLSQHHIVPQSVCEVGCGAGRILATLRDYLGPACRLVGYDIAPVLKDFWVKYEPKQIKFILGDFLESEANDIYDILLLIDLIEHLENPFNFLRRVLGRAKWIVLHIPLELDAQKAIRHASLLKSRQQFGHLHNWNKDLALMMLRECGLEVIYWEYTGGTVELPTPLLRTKLARWPRKIFFAISSDLAVRILGGYSLLVLAKGFL